MAPPIINDRNYRHYLPGGSDVPKGMSHGCKPRNFRTHPSGCYAYAKPFPAELMIPESEWQQRLDDQIQAKASNFDLREANYDILKSLDQDGKGLCWAFSTTKAVMYTRAKANVPGVRLSGWYTAGIVKNWQDEGGWCQESLEQVVNNGTTTEAMCPSYSRQYATAAVAADAATRKVTEWWDGTEDREQNRRIMISAFLQGFDLVLDLNWMSHSMCGCRLVSLNPLRLDADNSWGESSGERGLYRLEGNKAIPDNLVIPVVSSARAG